MRLLKKPPLISTLTNHLIDYPTPTNISYWWGLGSTSGIFLAIQLITGIFLAMHYTPHINLAFLSVEHIMRDINNGWLLRYTHANGASFFFLAVYLHIFRGMYYGSYMHPKGLTWIIGIVIFVLMMATAFLGYVLVWGQMSLWAATVITNLFSAVPIVGQAIVEWLWGGFSVDNATLNRFFSFHYLLPFAITAAVLIHLAALHYNGSNNPLGISAATDKVSFYPYFWVKDVLGWILFGILFSFFLFFYPNYLGHTDNYIEANPMVTPAHIVPEWYFLPYYAVLRSIPHKLGGVIAMFAAILVLMLLPYINTAEVRSSVFRPIYRKLYWIWILDWFVLGWIGGNVPETPYVEIGQIFTIYYFVFLLVIIPLLGIIENNFQNTKQIQHNNKKKISQTNSHSLHQRMTISLNIIKKNKITLYINGKKTENQNGITVLQACESVGEIIPRFCYHENLSIAGNCRMCLVEINKAPKLQASCALPATDGMEILTNTINVKKARESVMEFLLTNHPLDCVICDQGGECDLQDQALVFGNDHSRFNEYKRATTNKNFGSLIKTIMTRCIHCTRCVRFTTEIIKKESLGTIGRSNNMEIGINVFHNSKSIKTKNITFNKKSATINSEIAGNLIDLCPVGALTSEPFAYKVRSWELKTYETIDINDATNTTIKIDLAGTGANAIKRILPRIKTKTISIENLLEKKIKYQSNPQWISDKTRFCYDGLQIQRIISPIKKTEQNKYKKIKSTRKIDLNYKSAMIECIIGNDIDLNSLLLLKKVLQKKNYNNSIFIIPTESNKIKKRYKRETSETQLKNITKDKFNLSTLDFVPKIDQNIEQADTILIINSNTQFEANTLHYTIKKAKFTKKIGIIGNKKKEANNFLHLGQSLKTLIKIIEGRHSFAKHIMKAKKPLLLLGATAMQRKDSAAIWKLLETFFYINGKKIQPQLLHSETTSISGLILGIPCFNTYTTLKAKKKAIKNEKKIQYFLGNIREKQIKINKNAYKIVHNSHGTKLALKANLILPMQTYLEVKAKYASTFGIIQETKNSPNLLLKNKKPTMELINFYFKTLGLIEESNFETNMLNMGISKLKPFYNNEIILSQKPTVYTKIKTTKSKKKQELITKKNNKKILNIYTKRTNMLANNKATNFININQTLIKTKKTTQLRKITETLNTTIKLNITPLYSAIENFFITNTITSFSKNMAKKNNNNKL